jgi:hypothetical protein
MSSTVPNQTTPLNPQAATFINNVYNFPPDKGSSGYLPGRGFYYALEAAIHNAMLTRCIPSGDTCTPIYQTTYLVAFAAGTAFGLYKAMNKDKHFGVEERAKVFAKGGFGTKAIMVTELVMEGPLAILIGESAISSGHSLFGGLVTGYWAFNLGLDLSRWAYNNIKTDKKAE